MISIVSAMSHANLTVQVDRDQISDAELVKVTVRFDNPTSIQNPEWVNLARDFDVISQSGPNQNRSVRIVNGQQTSENYVLWELSLRPKRVGTLTIPPLRMAGFTSPAIQVQVSQASAAIKRKLNEFVFFDTSIDKSTVYVQGQIVYTIKLYYLDSISGEFPPPPALDNAIVEIIENEKRYDAMLNNRRYYVLEKRYAIYPQSSGEMVIPSETFSGTRGSRGFFSRGQQVVAVSEQHLIDVQPRPSAFTGNQWIPAKSLELSETWATNPPVFVLGEPINRTLILKVDGLASSLLPPFENLDIANAKTYEDPANKEQVTGADGIQSILTTTIGIVPTQAGTLTIPEVRIPWWNTVTDKQEIAILPEMSFTVSPGAQSARLAPEYQPRQNDEVQPAATAAVQPGLVTQNTNPLWMIVAAVASLLAIVMSIMWWMARTRLQAYTGNTEAEAQVPGPKKETELFNDLRKSCKNNEALAARNALFLWAKVRYPDINSIRDLGRKTLDQDESNALTAEISRLEAAIYSETPDTQWRGAGLLDKITNLQQQTTKPARISSLSPSLNPG